MAVKRSDSPIEPMDLANMRANGVRSLDVQCHQCRHRVIVNVDHLSGYLTVPSFGPKIVCTKCGTIGADVRPNWQERPQHESLTGK
jgi:DNA-directed RNA polymerase subunit RPC12/RpoP